MSPLHSTTPNCIRKGVCQCQEVVLCALRSDDIRRGVPTAGNGEDFLNHQRWRISRWSSFQLAFYSTGVDCFRSYSIRIGHKNEKRWGILFKFLTSCAVHINLLTSMDTDAFLMALILFIPRRGKPYELLCNQGANFKGGERELAQAFTLSRLSFKKLSNICGEQTCSRLAHHLLVSDLFYLHAELVWLSVDKASSK